MVSTLRLCGLTIDKQTDRQILYRQTERPTGLLLLLFIISSGSFDNRVSVKRRYQSPSDNSRKDKHTHTGLCVPPQSTPVCGSWVCVWVGYNPECLAVCLSQFEPKWGDSVFCKKQTLHACFQMCLGTCWIEEVLKWNFNDALRQTLSVQRQTVMGHKTGGKQRSSVSNRNHDVSVGLDPESIPFKTKSKGKKVKKRKKKIRTLVNTNQYRKICHVRFYHRFQT